MLRTLSLIAVLAASAAPAAASEIRIKTAGKDLAALKSEIKSAAERVCRRENAGSLFGIHMQAACVDRAVATAMSKVAAPTVASTTPLAVTRISSTQ